MNGIGGGQYGVVSNVLHHFRQSGSNFPCALHEAHDTQVYISSVNKYNCTAVRYHVDAQEVLHITPHKTSQKKSITHQHKALRTPIDNMPLIWRQMPLIKDVFLPTSYTVMTVDRSLSGITASKGVDIGCM